ncbi:hypothetical protein COP2_039197 [Malus domestica]
MASFDAFSMDGDNLHASNNHFDLDDVVIESYADYGSYTDRAAAVPASLDISKFKDPSALVNGLRFIETVQERRQQWWWRIRHQPQSKRVAMKSSPHREDSEVINAWGTHEGARRKTRHAAATACR